MEMGRVREADSKRKKTGKRKSEQDRDMRESSRDRERESKR